MLSYIIVIGFGYVSEKLIFTSGKAFKTLK